MNNAYEWQIALACFLLFPVQGLNHTISALVSGLVIENVRLDQEKTSMLKELQNCILCVTADGHYFVQKGLYWSAFHTCSFGELVFLRLLLFSVCSLFLICIMIVCIDARCSVIDIVLTLTGENRRIVL